MQYESRVTLSLCIGSSRSTGGLILLAAQPSVNHAFIRSYEIALGRVVGVKKRRATFVALLGFVSSESFLSLPPVVS